MFTRRTFVSDHLRLMGAWNEWLLFETKEECLCLVIVDSNGMEVSRLPCGGGEILILAGVSRNRAVVNVGSALGMVVVAFDTAGRKYMLKELKYCYAVWKDRLVAFSTDGMELWEWMEATPPGMELIMTQRFPLDGIPASFPDAVLGLRDTILISIHGVGIFERSDHDTLSGMECPDSRGWTRTIVLNLLEWKGFLFVTYINDSNASRLSVWDTKRNVIRSVPFDGRLCLGHDSMSAADRTIPPSTCGASVRGILRATIGIQGGCESTVLGLSTREFEDYRGI